MLFKNADIFYIVYISIFKHSETNFKFCIQTILLDHKHFTAS